MSDKYKIAFLAPINSIHTTRWVNGVSSNGYEVHLITQHKGALDGLDKSVKVHNLPLKGKLGYFLNMLSLKKILKKISPDLLHAHYASGYGTLARLSGFKPNILSVWGSDIYLFPKKSNFNFSLLDKNLRFADLITSSSLDMQEEIVLNYPDLKHKIKLVPFGVDTQLFSHSEKSKNKTEDKICVGTVKSLEKVYGIDILIKGFKLLLDDLNITDKTLAKKIKLLIVGKGSLYEELKNMVTDYGINDQVHFYGSIEHSDVPKVLNQMDIFVAVSRSESFGVAVLEASSCELPAIVSNIGGLKEVVLDGVTGTVIPSEDPVALSKMLKDLILNKDKRKKMGAEGRKRIMGLYKWENNLSSMLNLYNQTINNNQG